MPMLKTLASVDMTGLASQAAVELGETPFQLGGNCIMHMTAPIGGAGVITVEGSPDGTTNWTTVRTINAAQSAGQVVEITNLPPWIRTRVSTVGTGTIVPTLEGVQ